MYVRADLDDAQRPRTIMSSTRTPCRCRRVAPPWRNECDTYFALRPNSWHADLNTLRNFVEPPGNSSPRGGVCATTCRNNATTSGLATVTDWLRPVLATRIDSVVILYSWPM